MSNTTNTPNTPWYRRFNRLLGSIANRPNLGHDAWLPLSSHFTNLLDELEKNNEVYDKLYRFPGSHRLILDIVGESGYGPDHAYWLGEVGSPIVTVHIDVDDDSEGDDQEATAWAVLHGVRYDGPSPSWYAWARERRQYRYQKVATANYSIPAEDLGYTHKADDLARVAILEVLKQLPAFPNIVPQFKAEYEEFLNEQEWIAEATHAHLYPVDRPHQEGA